MKFNKKSLVDFNNEYRMVYFRYADLLGIDGVVSNVPIIKKTLPPHCETYYIKPSSEEENMITVFANGDKSYGPEFEDVKMFITYTKIDFGGDDRLELSSNRFRIYQDIMYRYELKEWIEEMREYRRRYLISQAAKERKKKEEERKEKERLKEILKVARVSVNDGWLEVLYANRIIVSDFYDKDAYKYYICASGANGVVRPDMLMCNYDENLTMFGTILSPVPIFMRKEFVELRSISIFDTEVRADDAARWIRRRICEYDARELLTVETIKEVVTNLLIKRDNFNPGKETHEEYIKNNSYEVAKAIKKRLGGSGVIGKIGDDYVWVNTVTGRCYDHSGRRKGKVKYEPEE